VGVNDLVNNAFGLISKSTINDLEYAIENNIDLSDKFERECKTELFFARTLKSLYEKEIRTITAERILNDIKVKRPDLHKVIVRDKKSILWFVKNINKIKKLVLD